MIPQHTKKDSTTRPIFNYSIFYPIARNLKALVLDLKKWINLNFSPNIGSWIKNLISLWKKIELPSILKKVLWSIPLKKFCCFCKGIFETLHIKTFHLSTILNMSFKIVFVYWDACLIFAARKVRHKMWEKFLTGVSSSKTEYTKTILHWNNSPGLVILAITRWEHASKWTISCRIIFINNLLKLI